MNGQVQIVGLAGLERPQRPQGVAGGLVRVPHGHALLHGRQPPAERQGRINAANQDLVGHVVQKRDLMVILAHEPLDGGDAGGIVVLVAEPDGKRFLPLGRQHVARLAGKEVQQTAHPEQELARLLEPLGLVVAHDAPPHQIAPQRLAAFAVPHVRHPERRLQIAQPARAFFQVWLDRVGRGRFVGAPAPFFQRRVTLGILAKHKVGLPQMLAKQPVKGGEDIRIAGHAAGI
jgi:hypothetical protein